ncbi:MAG: hypothetical protein IJJ45_00625 [Clostridia bacterium]|nr:hypothetical protein [Clostridia bacterium]
MEIIEWIAKHLEFCGLGTIADAETDGDIFWGLMPDTPDRCICVYSTDSGIGGEGDPARIQIVTRGNTVNDAYHLSQDIARAIIDFEGFLAGDGPQASIRKINTSQGIGADAKKREIYTSNYYVYYCD